MTDEEWETIQAAAARAEITASDLTRAAALRDARRILKQKGRR
jgi:hypothetical protein